MCLPALAAFLLASPIAAAASAAAAAADGLRVSLVAWGDWALPLWCAAGFTLPGLKCAAKASTSRIVAFTLPSTMSETKWKFCNNYYFIIRRTINLSQRHLVQLLLTRNIVNNSLLERFSLDCHKTKTKVNTLANQRA